MPRPVPTPARRLLILAALFSVYVFWGGTYLGIRLAVRTLPPFLMAGARFLVAGGAVYLYARLRGAGRPTFQQWLGAAAVGGLLLVTGNGVVSWAEQRVPSGIAALLLATVPLWVVLLGPDRRRAGLTTLAGILLGFVGIGVLVLPGGSGPDRGSLAGMAAILAASLSWTWGSLYARKAPLPASPLLANGMQMLVAGAVLVALSALGGEWSRLRLREVTFASFAGWAYLVTFGSIVAYNAYLWLMQNAEPTWVSTYAFVNPVVAVFAGWLIAGEQLTGTSLLATVIIVAAVVLITCARERTAPREAKPEAALPEPPEG